MTYLGDSLLLLDESTILKATRNFQEKDRVMSLLISRLGECTLHQETRDPFGALVSAIVSQQLSSKVSQAILGRLKSAMGERVNCPEAYLELKTSVILACGVSRAKARAILSLAEFSINGGLDLDTLSKLEDEAVVGKLTEIWGVGEWTAQMFLIFCLKRPNVIALRDAGLLRSHAFFYPRESFSESMLRWSPFCSIASWYLWRAIDELSKEEMQNFARA